MEYVLLSIHTQVVVLFVLRPRRSAKAKCQGKVPRQSDKAK